MAMKKRKVDQEDDLLHPSDNSTTQHRPVVYTPAPAVDDDDEAGGGGGGGDDGADADDDVGLMLEPLSRDQLISILSSAAASNRAALAEIHRVADLDPAQRKIFVHGLGRETNNDSLRACFSRFGDLEDCRVVFDRATGRSKGYGFVCFRHRRDACSALINPQNTIDNRVTTCQLASAGPSAPGQGSGGGGVHHPHHQISNSSTGPVDKQDNLPRKIYVGNVHSDIDAGRLLAFFSQFGDIEEGPIGFDRQTGKPKGFALFVYKTVDGALRALEEPQKNFDGHLLVCQKANDGKSKGAYNTNSTAPSNAPTGDASYNGAAHGAPPTDITLAAQQAALYGQGLFGVANPQAFVQGVQPNAAALALLASAAQSPAALGISPAMLASLNPALSAAFGAAGGQAAAVSSVPQSSGQNFGLGSVGLVSAFPTHQGFQGSQGFQGAQVFQGAPGYQVSPGLQGPPGFQAPPGFAQTAVPQGAAGGASYQGNQGGTSSMTRQTSGAMGTY